MPATNSSTVTSRAKGDSPNPAPAAAEGADKSHDFFWTYTEEPHRTRRLAIIKAHPEVRALLISPAVPWHVANLASIYRSPSSAVLSLSRNGSFSVSSLFRSSSHGCSSRLLSSHGSSGLSPTSLAPLPTRTFSSPSTRSHTTWLSEALVSTV